MTQNKTRKASVAVAVSVLGFSGVAQAGPSGGQVVHGDASITPDGLDTIIEQLSSKAVINWDDFSIDAGTLVKFIHQNSSDVTLNRVTGDTVSQIKGALTANGNIFLINPNGIVFGANAEVDVAGLLATTFDIADQDFLDGKFNFSGELMNNASITNQGKIELNGDGFVYLIAPNVENTGHIIANVGRVTLANDGSYDIDLTGNGLVTFSVTDNDLTGATGSVTNGPGGKIDAGHVLLSGSETSAVMSSVVNQGEITAATELTMAGDDLEQSGTITAGDTTLDADNAIVSNGGSISGGSATLKAGTGVGADSAVHTNVDDLAVSSESGAVRVNEADELDSLSIATGDSAEVNFQQAGTDPVSGGPIQEDVSVQFNGQTLSASRDTVKTDLDFTHGDGGVTLSGVNVDGDLSVTAAGNIVGDDNLNTAARGERVSLTTTQDGASIGTENNALRIDADTLRAEAKKGHVVLTDTDGDLTLERVSTGDNSAEAGLRALITAEDGDLRGSLGAEANVEAWAANLQADGAIGDHGQAVTTAVDVLSASTQDGSIHVDEQDGELMLGKVVAGERISQAGQTVSSTGVSGADGSVTLSTGAPGSHDIIISADDNILIGDQISAPRQLAILSRWGGIYKNGDTATITGSSIHLEAAGRIGQDGNALKTQSDRIDAWSGDDGIYLSEDNGLYAGNILAQGDNADVRLEASLGDVVLGMVEAEQGDVTVVSQDGDILADVYGGVNVRADHLTLDAEGAIGTAAQALSTGVNTLTTATGTNLAGTYVANTGLLSSLGVTTLGGNVAITDADGGVTFDRANEHLTVQRAGGEGLDLAFNNGAGNLIVEGADLSGHDVDLTASGRIGDGGGVFAASDLTLNAGDDIELTTDADAIDATTADGDIALDNRGEGTLTLNAEAGGDDHGVTVSHEGDLTLGQISGDGLIRLTAAGDLNGDGDNTAITGNFVELDADRIGDAGQALSTAITGRLSMLSDGDIYVSNVGALSLLEGEAGGDIDFSQAGDTVLGRLASGGSVTFYATGRVSDGNGDSDNIVADDLDLEAQQVGAADGTVDALEIRVDELVVNANDGGIYLRNRDNGPLSLIRAGAAGGDVNIDTVGNMNLGTVTAAGGNVTLTSDGAINDARPDGASEANVVARKVDMRAQQGVGNTGPMVLDVDQMSVSGGNGDVNAASPGAVEVDADSLVGKGASGVTIVAASITVLDNNGGTLVMAGGKLVLTATNGNIVFLNQDDTIRLPGGGSITLTARADSTNEGYNGNIITGNLVTEGGDITLDADRNVTLGMLDTGGTGDVYVIARDGVILDGNGADQNVRGDYVSWIGNTPSERDAEIARDTAIADYAGRVAELNAKILQLQTLQQQLEAYIAALNSAIVNKNISQQNLSSAQRTVDRLSSQVNSAQRTLDSLNRVVSAASIAVEAMALVAGGAQAIPFSGDGGAAATFEGLSLALSAAQFAVDEFDRETFSPLNDDLNEAMNHLDVAKSFHQDAITNVESWTTLRNTTRVSRDMADHSVFKATAARDASEALRGQSIAAYDQAQDIDMSAAKPLGIQANQLDMGTSSGRALNSGVYLDSTGNLGLGDIKSVGEIRAENVAGNISVVGDVVSPTLISLQADGAVRGIGGTWVDGQWVPEVGELNAPIMALRGGQGVGEQEDSVYVNTGEIAIDGGDGNAFVINDNGGDELVLGTVDGLSGLTAAGDMGLRNNGDLRLKTQIIDTDVTVDSDTYLIADDGAIIDDNGDTLNVTGGDLYFHADGRVELDTLVNRVVDGGTSDGDILLRERDDLALIALETLDGDIDVIAGGNLTVHELAAGGDSAVIALDADGRIDDDQHNDTRIAAKRLELNAGGGIGAIGADNVRGLDTAVDVVTADAKGEINLHDADDLDVEKVATTTGNVTLTSDAGDLHLGEVRTDGDGGNITLVADGAIDALNDADATPELYADQLALRAGEGIGSADQALLIETGALEADAGDGGLYLLNQNRDLTVGGVTPNLGLPGLTGLDANGDLHLTVADGALTVNEDVTQTGEGDTRLSSAMGQLVNADLDAAGDLTLQANSGDITAVSASQLLSGGDLSATASEGGVSLVQNSRAQATGDLSLKGGTTVSLTDASAEAGADLTFTGEEGNVTLANSQATGADDVTVSAGENITLSGASSLTATNGALEATATSGNLELNGNSAATAATTLDLRAGNQVSLSNATAQSGDDMSVTADDGDVLLTNSRAASEGAQTVSAGGSVRLTQSQLHTETDGDLTVTAEGGDISLTVSQMLAGGAFDGDAAGDVVLGSGLISAGGSSLPDVDGSLNLDAGNNVRLTQGSTVTGTGDTHVGAKDGELLVVDSGQVLSGADLDLNAGTNVTLHTGVAKADQDLTVTAGQDVRLSGGAQLLAEEGKLSATAEAGDLLLSQNSLIGAAGQVDLTADQAMTLTSAMIAAGADLNLTARQGSMTIMQSNVGAGEDLTATAGQDVLMSAGSYLTASTGPLSATATNGTLDVSQSSRVEGFDKVSLRAGTKMAFSTGASVDAGGDLDLDAGNHLSVEDANVSADGDATLTAGDGNLVVTRSSVNAGGFLDGDAGQGILLTNATLNSGQRHHIRSLAPLVDDNVDLTLNAGSGDIALSQGSTVASAGALTLGSEEGSIVLTNSSRAEATTDATLDAGTDVRLSNGARVDAGSGDLTVTAANGDLSVTSGGALTAGNDLDISVRGGVTVSEASARAEGDLSLTATDGDLAMTNASVTAGGALTGEVGGDATLTRSVLVSGDATDAEPANLSLAAGGGIAMDADSAMHSNADLTLKAGDDVALSTLRAVGDVSVTSEEGGIQADPAVAEHIHGDNLFLSAAKSIGTTLSGLKTRVSNLYATLTGSGDLYLEDVDALTVKESSLADGNAQLRTGADLTIEGLAVNGNARLDSAGRIVTGEDGLVRADNLQATAVDGIQLNSELDSASLAVTGEGDIDVGNGGDLRLDTVAAQDGDVDVRTDGDLDVDRVYTQGEHGIALTASGAINAVGYGLVDGRYVTLRAGNGIGADAALNLHAATLDALSDSGDIDLTQSFGDLALERVRTGDGDISVTLGDGNLTLGDIHADGDVTLTAAQGRLDNDADDATLVSGDTVTLSSANGLGTESNNLVTRATRLDAQVSGAGDIHLTEQDGLAGLNARAANGDIKVRTLQGNLTVGEVEALTPGKAVMLSSVAGAILDGNAEANNIVASLLELSAASGIARASDPLDVDVSTLAATGGSGGVYINNRGTGPLTVTGLTGNGGLGLTTGGDLDLNGDVQGRTVALGAGGDLTQRGRITGTDGVTVAGNGDVTMTDGAHTQSNGQVYYGAGQTLTVNTIYTDDSLPGSTVILEGRNLRSNASGPGSIRAGQLDVRVPNVDGDRVYDMLDTFNGKARVVVNGRTQGGEIVEDSQYVADLTASRGPLPRMVMNPFESFQPQTTGQGFQPVPGDNGEWHYNP